jgi:hypothetical protein
MRPDATDQMPMRRDGPVDTSADEGHYAGPGDGRGEGGRSLPVGREKR